LNVLHGRPVAGQLDREAFDDPPLPPLSRAPVPIFDIGRSPVTDPIVVAGRRLEPTPVFESYWRFAAERHRVYLRRLAGDPGPWTADPVIAQHRFTNAYRAADRVSQYLIRHVIYSGTQERDEIVFRILLFKFFNKIDTWALLYRAVGVPSWGEYDFAAYENALASARAKGATLYSPAYIVPPPRLREQTKYANHLRLVEMMMGRGLCEALDGAKRLRDVYEVLTAYPSVGRFIGFQLAVDLNYSNVTAFSEMDFVVAGPGARDGIRKCFGAASSGIEDDLIRFVAENQARYFESLGLPFAGLFGRPLQLVDCQNIFCEVDKYARAAHPEVRGPSGRVRIKQRYRPNPAALSAWFPPKWRLNSRVSTFS
jgi:hypothetical protein